jgi:hypothetical protein
LADDAWSAAEFPVDASASGIIKSAIDTPTLRKCFMSSPCVGKKQIVPIADEPVPLL